MFARVLSILALALAALAHAAPAPLPRFETFAPVDLRGTMPHMSLAGGPPQVIGTPEAYRRLTSEWGITSPPKVTFRTHFLLVTTTAGGSEVGYELIGTDLRAVPPTPFLKCGLSLHVPAGYRIRSFSRSEVKSVGGVPL